MLSALADALGLTAAEHVHLHRLAKAADGGFSCTFGDAPPAVLRPTVRALVDRLGTTPAAVLTRLGEVLAHSAGYARLFGPLGLLEGAPPNPTRFLFTDPRAREVFPDWDAVADEHVAALKQGPFVGAPRMAAFAEELAEAAGEAFTDRVRELPGPPRASGVTRVRHREAGELRLAHELLDLPGEGDLRLLVQLPADAATEAAFDRLTGLRPGALRAVPG